MVTAIIRAALVSAAVALAALATGSLASNPAVAGASASAHTKYHDGLSAVGSGQVQPATSTRRVRRNHH
jgi:hypothetical protein